ncbi:hypothetical protein BDU57DRAFT_534588 [Ampelomyces quisqualis]|uniref:Uncharacterized protein n=1 Tax=Ampelomyces quisqualis TaxID=50730 RepID=A0A6A5R144_AMPQU|nr:hypothetical protein BDU57DRAFT_534588 [Ampelomyces quisqualis]
MSGFQGETISPSQSTAAQSPPFSPRNQGLGGNPAVIPDVPVTVVFLVLYLVFGVIHIKILKANKGRGHKFIFNGAILGLCKIRIVTMSLRIAWACSPRNVGLGIAANVFVYVGTIILFMINWFFVQRVVRAQHQRLGWSTQYRVFHRGALVVLITTLIMLIIANIWQFFTVEDTKLHAFRALVLTGQTYFTIFCFAPAIIVLISVLIPRHEIEKFGAGRLRINITILLIAVAVLTTGQLFRCVIAWIPQTPVLGFAGQPVDKPWYLHRACFYVFNFVTEIIVVVMFALVRVDLRFHVPDKSRMSGDYSGRNSVMDFSSKSKVDLAQEASEKSLECEAPVVPTSHRNESRETLHQYETSVFEDSRTLADSLQYGDSTLEVDNKTGAWKVKRVSTGSVSSRFSSVEPNQISSRTTFNDRSITFADKPPPVPGIPSEWPLPISSTQSIPMSSRGQSNPLRRAETPKKTFEIADHDLNGVDVGDAITYALAALEQNSENNRKQSARQVRAQTSAGTSSKASIEPMQTHDEEDQTATEAQTPDTKKNKTRLHNPLAPRQRATFPPKSALKTPQARTRDDRTIQNVSIPVDTPIVPQLSPSTAAPPASNSSPHSNDTTPPRAESLT